jgi:undecaprenyl diphosphate synthase
MDGNRRWAREKGLPELEGHRRGLYDALIPILKACREREIKYITIWAFSTENWKRSKKEIGYLMKLFEALFRDKLAEMKKEGVKINVIGRLTDFPERIQQLAKKAVEETRNNQEATLNIAMSYGGHAEIVDATKKIITDGIKPEDVTEEIFSKYIYEAGQPNLDLIIRTSGEYRLSGFLLWQSDYSELYFSQVKWPDFDEKELDKALDFYVNRDRRFGG